MPDAVDVSPAVRTLHVDTEVYTGHFPPNVHVIHDGGEAMFIDSGFPDEDALKVRLGFLDEHPELRLTHIALTHHHFDHSSGAPTYRERTGAKIAIHGDDVEPLLNPGEEAPQDIDLDETEIDEEQRKRYATWMAEARRATPDIRLSDGSEIVVGGKRVVAVHTPGHTWGHLCFYLPDERLMFTGDCVLGVGTSAVPPPPHGDMRAYVESLRRLQTFDIEQLIPGHGPAITKPQAKLAELIQHRLDRDAQVLSGLRKGKHTIGELMKSIYPELDKRLFRMARGQIRSHLAKLEAEGHAVREGEGDDERWRLA